MCVPGSLAAVVLHSGLLHFSPLKCFMRGLINMYGSILARRSLSDRLSFQSCSLWTKRSDWRAATGPALPILSFHRTSQAAIRTVLIRQLGTLPDFLLSAQGMLDKWLTRSTAFTALRSATADSRGSALRCIRRIDEHLGASCSEVRACFVPFSSRLRFDF